jgi:pimeloyl-ACP methyl ester carboxylesterase
MTLRGSADDQLERRKRKETGEEGTAVATESCSACEAGRDQRALARLVGAPWPLPGQRRCFRVGSQTLNLREIDGPAGAGSVVLLHGWAASADLNFAALYRDLAARWHVVAPDQRGHGRPARTAAGPFSLEACADDAAALIQRTSSAPALVLGYSMGGPVGLLLARRHPDAVAGLVLVATAACFTHGIGERAALALMGVAGNLGSHLGSRICTLGHRLRDVCPVLQAGGALNRFCADAWLGELRVPSAVVVTADDHLVPASDQLHLADSIPGARRLMVAADHDLCVRRPRRFAAASVQALCTVEQAWKSIRH